MFEPPLLLLQLCRPTLQNRSSLGTTWRPTHLLYQLSAEFAGTRLLAARTAQRGRMRRLHFILQFLWGNTENILPVAIHKETQFAETRTPVNRTTPSQTQTSGSDDDPTAESKDVLEIVRLRPYLYAHQRSQQSSRLDDLIDLLDL